MHLNSLVVITLYLHSMYSDVPQSPQVTTRKEYSQQIVKDLHLLTRGVLGQQ